VKKLRMSVGHSCNATFSLLLAKILTKKLNEKVLQKSHPAWKIFSVLNFLVPLFW
jgi:hypothetical protein